MSHRTEIQDDASIDLGAILGALWRAKRWIVPLVLLTAVATAVGLGLVAPKYKGEARVLIEARPLILREAGERTAEQDRALLDQEGIVSQVQLMSSRDLARRVVAAEHLADAKEFAPEGGLASGLLRAVGLSRESTRNSPEERLLEAFFDRLAVFQVEKSRVIQVEFSSTDPDLAARVANAVVREYLALQGEAKVKDSVEATRWLESEIAALRSKVSEAEAKVETYRSGNELFVSTNNNTLVQQQLGELNTQLTAARAVKSDAEAKSAQLKRIVEQGGTIDQATEVANQPLFQRLRERQIALRSRIAELSAVYLPGHPQIRALDAQLRDIDGQIRTEARKILAALDNDVRVADQRIRELRTQLGEFKSQAARANQEDVQLRALERDAKAQRDLLESLLARYREASSRVSIGAEPANARVISRATPPVKPYFPKVVPITIVVTLAVFLLAATFVVLRELTSGRAMVGAAMPRAPGAGAAPAPLVTPLERLAAADPATRPGAPPSADRSADGPGPTQVPLARSGDVERADASRLWARLAAGSERPKLVVIVAAGDARLADDAALALGRAAAASAAPVCLVALSGDAVAADLAVDGRPAGFRDLLAGRAGFGEAIHRDRRSRLHVVPAGTTADAPLDRERAAGVVDALQLCYDHVLVDVGALTDADPAALDLAGLADRIVVATGPSGPDAADETVVAALDRAGAGRVSILSLGAAADGAAVRAA